MNAYAAMTELSLNFIHKRIAAAGIGFLTGGPSAGIQGFIGGGGDSTALADPRTQGAGTSVGCGAGFMRTAQGQCVPAPTSQVAIEGIVGATQRFLPGGETGFQDVFGGAVMGRFGAALVPAQMQATRLRCPRGAVLGKDNLCYDHLPKKDRKWNPGTKPLLTGGQMNILRKARRLEDRLKRMGVPIHVHKRKASRKLLR